MRIVFNASILSNARNSGVEHAVRGLALALKKLYPEEVEIKVGGKKQSRLGRIFSEIGIFSAANGEIFHAPAYLFPLFMRKAKNCAYVLTIYDLHVFSHPQFCRLANLFHYRARLPAAIRRADLIIVPSQEVFEELRARFPAAEKKTQIIPLGITLPDAESEKVGGFQDAAEPYLVFLGNLEKRKNLRTLLAALERLPSPPALKIVTPRRGKLRARKSPRLNSEALFGANDDEVRALLEKSAALVYPSLDEGFGLPVLEAAALGCPVICAKNIPAAKLIADYPHFLSDPGDAAELSAAIEKVIAKKSPRQKIKLSQYSWESVAEKTYRAYAKALESVRARDE